MHGENMKLHVYQFSTITTLHLVLQTIKNTAYYNKKRLSTFLYDEHLGHTNCRQWRRLFATALRGPSSLYRTRTGTLSLESRRPKHHAVHSTHLKTKEDVEVYLRYCMA